MKRQYFEATPVLRGSFWATPGDGIAMAQKGAALWHMWHLHGPYGMRHPRSRTRFLHEGAADGTPARDNKCRPSVAADAARRDTLPRMAWIVVDQDGRRFMDEYPPYPGDTGAGPSRCSDFHRQRFPRIPRSFLRRGRPRDVSDRPAGDQRPRLSLCMERGQRRRSSSGSSERADSLAELARKLGLDADGSARVDRVALNVAVEEGVDRDWTPTETMVPLRTPPFMRRRFIRW